MMLGWFFFFTVSRGSGIIQKWSLTGRVRVNRVPRREE